MKNERPRRYGTLKEMGFPKEARFIYEGKKKVGVRVPSGPSPIEDKPSLKSELIPQGR